MTEYIDVHATQAANLMSEARECLEATDHKYKDDVMALYRVTMGLVCLMAEGKLTEDDIGAARALRQVMELGDDASD